MESARPIIPWPGGKRRLARHILPLFPAHTCYVEAFAGGAGLLFCRPEPAHVEVLNDIHGELVRLYRCVQHHLEEFVRQFKWALVSREMFRWAQLQHVDTLTDIQRAARFYYLQQLAFGGKVHGQTFGYASTCPPGLNLLRIEEELSAAHLRLARVLIENLPWQDCIARYDSADTLCYLDPPYWQTEGYGVEFGMEHYQQLAETMATMQGAAVLSVNDHADMRAVFARFKIDTCSIRYTLGGDSASRTTRSELIIRNDQCLARPPARRDPELWTR